jgi:anaerobic selenocysteine-containing dehydrogenase
MHCNQEKFTTLIFSVGHVVAEKHPALASWHVHLIAKKDQPQLHVVFVNPVQI